MKVRLIDEKEIYFGDHYGKEFVVENETITVTQRVLFIEQRFFQLFVITKGNHSKLSEKSKAYNQDKVNKFFNSFSVTRLPAIKETAIELPESFGVKIENSVFRSDYFGVTIALPKNWNVVDREETEVLKDISRQNINSNLPGLADKTNLSLKNTEILLMLTKVSLDKGINDAVLTISAEKTSFPNFLPKAVIKSFEKEAVTDDETVTISNPSQMLGGKEFAWIETFNRVRNTKNRFYVANLNGIAFEIFLLYKNEGDLNLMLEAIKGIKFDRLP